MSLGISPTEVSAFPSGLLRQKNISLAVQTVRERERLERISSHADLTVLFWMVYAWVQARPTMALSDRDAEHVFGRARDEIFETKAEHELEGTALFSLPDLKMESIDTAFFKLSGIAALGILPDDYSIRAGANGQGRHVGVYERMAEATGDITHKRQDIEATVTHLLTLWLSTLLHMPGEIHAIQRMREVLHKNGTWDTGNYPAMYFQGKDGLGKELPEDEQEASYEHAVKCLQLIRKFYKKVLGQYRVNGLERDDHLPWSAYIRDYHHPESLEKLELLLHTKFNKLPELAQKKAVEQHERDRQRLQTASQWPVVIFPATSPD